MLSTKAGMRLAEYTVTEAGFGADLGAQKFFDIKCRKTGLAPDVAVVVATVRALKLHGGIDAGALRPKPGSLKDPESRMHFDEKGDEDVLAVERGMENLTKHVENVRGYGIPVIVAINQFPTDTEAELKAVEAGCIAAGCESVRATHWNTGGEGAADLAKRVVEIAEKGEADFKPLYPNSMPLEDKVRGKRDEIAYPAACSGVCVCVCSARRRRVRRDILPSCL